MYVKKKNSQPGLPGLLRVRYLRTGELLCKICPQVNLLFCLTIAKRRKTIRALYFVHQSMSRSGEFVSVSNSLKLQLTHHTRLSFIGAASFELPWAFTQGGLVGSTVGVLFLALMSMFSLNRLAQCSVMTAEGGRTKTFPEIGRGTFQCRIVSSNNIHTYNTHIYIYDSCVWQDRIHCSMVWDDSHVTWCHRIIRCVHIFDFGRVDRVSETNRG